MAYMCLCVHVFNRNVGTQMCGGEYIQVHTCGGLELCQMSPSKLSTFSIDTGSLIEPRDQ